MEHIYLRFEGDTEITSLQNPHDDETSSEWIEVLDWQHGSSGLEKTATAASMNHDPESVGHNSIVLIKAIDAISSTIKSAFEQEKIFSKVILEVMRINQNKKISNLEMILDQVIIASVAPAEKYKDLDSEKITLKYQSIKWTYSIGAIGNKSRNNAHPEFDRNKAGQSIQGEHWPEVMP